MDEARRKRFQVAGAAETQAAIQAAAEPKVIFEVKVQVIEGAPAPVITHPIFAPGKEHQGMIAVVDLLLEAAQGVNRKQGEDPSRIVRV